MKVHSLLKEHLIFKAGLAAVGAVLGAYVGEEWVGGGALGAMATGAIVAVLAAPLFRTLLAWRRDQLKSPARSEPARGDGDHDA